MDKDIKDNKDSKDKKDNININAEESISTSKIDKSDLNENNNENNEIIDNNAAGNLIPPPPDKMDPIDHFNDSVGYGPLQFKIISVLIMTKIAEGFHMALFSHIIIPFKRFYNISEYVTMFISSIIFFGYGIGCLLPGYLLLIFSRRFVAIIACSSLFMLSVLLAIFDNYFVFTIIRFFAGICFGILKPLFYSLVVEILPKFLRPLFICSEQFFFLLGGATILNGIMILLMPSLKILSLTKVLFTIPISALILLFLCVAFVRDSPRHLFIIGRPNEAIHELEAMVKFKFSEQEREELKSKIVKQESGTLTDLMQKKYLRIVILLSFMFIFNAYMLYTVLLISSLTFESNYYEISAEDILKKQTMVFWMLLPGSLVAGFLCEVPFLGRKLVLIIGYALFALMGIFAIIFRKYFDVFLGLMGFFLQFNYNITYVYCLEAFPTKIRGIAIGFCVFWTRLSGFGTHFLIVALHNVHYMLPYGIGIAFGGIGVILSYFLPFDTIDRPIETEIQDSPEEVRKSQNKNKNIDNDENLIEGTFDKTKINADEMNENDENIEIKGKNDKNDSIVVNKQLKKEKEL